MLNQRQGDGSKAPSGKTGSLEIMKEGSSIKRLQDRKMKAILQKAS